VAFQFAGYAATGPAGVAATLLRSRCTSTRAATPS
jgi:hypothetical protein